MIPHFSVKVLSGLQVIFVFALSLTLTGYLSIAASDTITLITQLTLARTLDYVRINVTSELEMAAICPRMIYFQQSHQTRFVASQDPKSLLSLSDEFLHCLVVKRTIREVYMMQVDYIIDPRTNLSKRFITHLGCRYDDTELIFNETAHEHAGLVCETITSSKQLFEFNQTTDTWVNRTLERADYISEHNDSAGFIQFALDLNQPNPPKTAFETDVWIEIPIFTTVLRQKVSSLSWMYYFTDMELSEVNRMLKRTKLSENDYLILYDSDWRIVSAAVPDDESNPEILSHGKRTKNKNVNIITESVLSSDRQQSSNETLRIVLRNEVYVGCWDTLDLLVENKIELTWYLTILIPEYIMFEGVRETRFNAYVLAGVLTFFVVFLSFAQAKSLMIPLQTLSDVVHGAADLNCKQRIPPTYFIEIFTFGAHIKSFLKKLEGFKKHLPADVFPADDNEETETQEVIERGACVTAIHLVRVSRTTLEKKATSNFSFQYKIGAKDIYEKLLSACRNKVNLTVGQAVRLQYSVDGDWCTIASERDFHQALTVHPDALMLRIFRCVEPSTWPITCCLLSIGSTIAVALFAQHLVKTGSSGLGGITVICLCAQFVVNLYVSLSIFRGQHFKQFSMEEWLANRATEAAVGLMLATFQVCNLHLLSCGYGFQDVFTFQAPFTRDIQILIDRWAAPGALIGNVVPFGIAVYSFVEDEQLILSNPIAVAVLTAVTFAWYGSRHSEKIEMVSTTVIKHVRGRTSSMLNTAGIASTFATLAQALTNPTESNTETLLLHRKHISVLICVFRDLAFLPDLHSESHRSAFHGKSTQYFDTIFKVARRYGGVVTHFDNGEVVVTFNASTSVGNHERSCISCGLEITSNQHNLPISCVMVAGEMEVGNIGAASQRSFQHLSPEYFMCRAVGNHVLSYDPPRNIFVAIGEELLHGIQNTPEKLSSKPLGCMKYRFEYRGKEYGCAEVFYHTVCVEEDLPKLEKMVFDNVLQDVLLQPRVTVIQSQRPKPRTTSTTSPSCGVETIVKHKEVIKIQRSERLDLFPQAASKKQYERSISMSDRGCSISLKGFGSEEIDNMSHTTSALQQPFLLRRTVNL